MSKVYTIPFTFEGSGKGEQRSSKTVKELGTEFATHGRAFTNKANGLKIKCRFLKIDVESVIQIRSIQTKRG
jgi:hypothetical protein